jgi:predicted nuclease of predicted toxin-antitoxin system
LKLLLDENLSHRLVRDLAQIYPESTHVRDIGLRGAEDRRIWDHAAERDMLLTSKDADFYQRSLMFGTPPKVVWLRIGNTSTEEVSSLLRRSHPLVLRFYEDTEASFLILEPDDPRIDDAPEG